MKKLNSTLIVLLITSVFSLSYAQKSDTLRTSKGDTMRFDLPNMDIIIIKNPEQHKGNDSALIYGNDTTWKSIKKKMGYYTKYWSGFDVGFNGYLNRNNTLELPAGFEFLELEFNKSFTFNVNTFERQLKLYKNYVHLVSGLNFEFNNYRFEKNISLIPDNNVIWATEDTIDYNKNKLTVCYLNVPLLIGFNTNNNPRKALKFSTGVIFGVRMGSHTKQVYEVGKQKLKPKVYDDFNLSPFKYGAVARVGFRELSLFAKYSFSSLFKNGQGPELHPYSIGITFEI